MSLEKVRAYFEKYGIADRIMVLEASSETVALAAQEIGSEECRLAKTLSLSVGRSPVLILTSGNTNISNHKYKAFFGEKAKMLSHEEAASLIGHAVGGVCPFAVNENVRVFLDESLRRYETVFPACGSGNSAIELTIPELEKYSGYERWADVCKLPE